MKRGWTLLLAALTLAALLTACGGDARNDSSGTGTAGSRDDTYQDNGTSQNGTDNGTLQNGTDNGSLQNGMDDIRNGMEDTMRDIGDAGENLLDDMTPNAAPRGTSRRQNGPAWSGNLRKPDFPGGFNGKL